MLPRFEHTTRASFKAMLVKKHGDMEKVFVTDDEWNSYIKEALLTFGGLSQSWKEEIEVKTNITSPFYNLLTDLNIDQQLLGFTLNFQFIIDQINYHLVEEVSAINPISEITSIDEILKFARNRVNQYQFLTKLWISQLQLNMPAADFAKLPMQDRMIDIVRVAYVDLNALENPKKHYILKEESLDMLSNFQRASFNASAPFPQFYETTSHYEKALIIHPTPQNLGALNLLVVNGFSTSETIFENSIVPVLNNLVPYIKWGIMYDIFCKDGLASNPALAAYCLSRWNEGVIVGLGYASILFALINGVPINLDSIDSLDNHDSGWFNKNNSMPSLLATAGFNFFATNRVPDDVYSLILTCVTNAYLPIDDDDFIDVKQEYIEALLNYTLHLSSFKDGAASLQNTNEGKNDFIKTATMYNARLNRNNIAFESLLKNQAVN